MVVPVALAARVDAVGVEGLPQVALAAQFADFALRYPGVYEARDLLGL